MTSVSCSSWEETRDSRYDVRASTAFVIRVYRNRGAKRQKRAQTLFRALSSVINDKELTIFTGDPSPIEINTILGGREEGRKK